MKIKNLFKYMAVAAVTLSMGSCGEDFLDRTPLNQYTAPTFYSSDAAVRKATEPLYNRAWFNFNRRAMLGMGSQRANDAWNPYVSAEFARFQLTGLTEDLGLAWSSLYVVVTMANALIDEVPKYSTEDVTEATKNAAMGEAYLMRATAYFYLLRSWGEVIVFEDNIQASQLPVIPLTKEEDVLKFIVRDLERASELLPEDGVDHHPSKYAAKAMLAKVLLAQSGWQTNRTVDGERDQATLDRVVALCDEVINSGKYALMDNYEDLFKYANNDNEETILAMRWADPLSGEWGAMNAIYSDLAFPEVSDVNVWGGNLYASVDMLNYYNEEPADSFRLRATFFTPGRHYDYVKASEGGYTYSHNWVQVKKGVVGTKADCNGHLAQMASPMNTYIMRLADVYLIKAEAILGNAPSTSDAEGLAAINAVRNRAKVKPLTSYDFNTLIRERRIEFCVENANWFDMVTWYRWRPQFMLDFFNNKQYRAFEIREGDLRLNEDGSFSYTCYPAGTWYFTVWDYDLDGDGKNDEVRLWNDSMRDTNGNIISLNGVPQDKAHGYEFDLDKLFREKLADGAVHVTLSEANIFMPYPEADVLQNHYFREAPQNYDFGE